MNKKPKPVEHSEAEQAKADEKRTKLIENLSDKQKGDHEFIDQFIKEATERNISVYLDARLPVPHPNHDEYVIQNNIQFNNDRKVVIKEDETTGFASKDSLILLTEINHMRSMNFMRFINFVTTGEHKSAKEMCEHFIGYMEYISKRYFTQPFKLDEDNNEKI